MTVRRPRNLHTTSIKASISFFLKSMIWVKLYLIKSIMCNSIACVSNLTVEIAEDAPKVT